MTITRYEMVRGYYDRHQMTEQDDGDYVLHADAEAHLTALLRAAYERGVRDAAARMAEPSMLGLTITKMEQAILALLAQEKTE